MITAENSNTFEFILSSGVAETQYTIINAILTAFMWKCIVFIMRFKPRLQYTV